MSGSSFIFGYRHPYLNLNPVTISSNMNSELFLFAISCIPCKYSCVAGIAPPPPKTGSIKTPAKSFFTDFKILNDSSKLFNGSETICSSSVNPWLSETSNGQFTVFSKSVVYPCQPPSIFAIIFFPVTARANLTEYIVASVPVDA